MQSPHHVLHLLRKSLAAVLLIAVASVGLAAEIVKGKRVYFLHEDGDKYYASFDAACRADIRQRGYKFLSSADGSCSYKDESRDAEGTTMAPARWTSCPQHSSIYSHDEELCVCDDNADGVYVASNGQCVLERSSVAAKAALPAVPQSTKGEGAGNQNDRCLLGPAVDQGGKVNPPDKDKCPRSFRAWEIREALARLGGKASGAAKGAISVSEGELKNGEVVWLVTTNNPRLHSALMDQKKQKDQKKKSILKVGESVGPEPKGIAQPHNNKNSAYEHAEDAALEWWKGQAKNGNVKLAKGVVMGTDPKACQFCADEYALPRENPKEFPNWVTHERLKR